MHYLLFYEKAADAPVREREFQADHRAYCAAAVRRGELMLGGSLVDPEDGRAVLLFKTDKPSVVEAFAKGDPYVAAGIVKRWRVRTWWTVVGHAAEAAPKPVPPQ